MGPLRDRGIRDLADLGSGGGFPGIPLAVALGTADGLLVESVAKKAAFLAAAVDAAGLTGRVGVAAVRAETLAADPAHRGHWPAVTARAVAELAGLIELAMPLLAMGGWLVAWKGASVAGELPAARRAAEALGGAPPEIAPAPIPGAADHCLAFVRKAGPTPSDYPRDPTARRRRPW